MNNNTFTIGLIGYGRFGKLIAPYLARYGLVGVYDPYAERSSRLPGGVRCAKLKEAASAGVVILSVPVRRFSDSLISISPYLRRGTVVVDVCAVKSEPAKLMKSILPKNVHLLGTHPLFGPDSIDDGLEGKTIAVCHLRMPQRLQRETNRILKKAGLTVVLQTPSEHDRAIAETLFVSQYVGRLLGMSGVTKTKVSTPHYEHLLKVVDAARNDSSHVLEDIVTYNRYVPLVHKRLAVSHARLSQKQGF